MKYSILESYEGNYHIVCRPDKFRAGDYITPVDVDGDVVMLEESHSGKLGKSVGGMFFAYDFKVYAGRYVKVLSTNKKMHNPPRFVLTEKTLPLCSTMWLFER